MPRSSRTQKQEAGTKTKKQTPLQVMCVARNPGEDPPQDAEEAAANIDDRLRQMCQAREAVSKNKLKRLLQINDDTGGVKWKTGEIEIQEERLVDAILTLP